LLDSLAIEQAHKVLEHFRLKDPVLLRQDTL
jgi:hypothetical protein